MRKGMRGGGDYEKRDAGGGGDCEKGDAGRTIRKEMGGNCEKRIQEEM